MRVTVIPSDKMVYIDNDVIQFDFVLDPDIPTIHAIQWNGTFGHIEHIDEYGRMIAVESIDSVDFIQPLIDEAILKIEDAKKQMAELLKPPVTSNTVTTGPTIVG